VRTWAVLNAWIIWPHEQGGIGDVLFRVVCNMGLEGIVSKQLDRAYGAGRCKYWIKIKNPARPAYFRGQGRTLGFSVPNISRWIGNTISSSLPMYLGNSLAICAHRCHAVDWHSAQRGSSRDREKVEMRTFIRSHKTVTESCNKIFPGLTKRYGQWVQPSEPFACSRGCTRPDL
jgi:hypothetical protein